MHSEVGHSSILHIVRNIRDNMEFLELAGGGTHQPCSDACSDARRGGRTQVDEAEDDALWPHSETRKGTRGVTLPAGALKKKQNKNENKFKLYSGGNLLYSNLF